MDALVAATMEKGFLPPVVMELPNITTGGGFAGTSGESSSFRYGTFDCIFNSIEVVLGNGDVVRAKTGDPETEDLLYGCAGGCGTLGIVTLLEIQLIPAKTYVELTYWPVSSSAEAITKLQDFEKDKSIDYIDGILFSPTSGVIMTGKLSDTLVLDRKKPQTFDKAADPWFYLHAQSVIEISKGRNKPYVESIPTASYLFRYDRAVFWSGALAFDYFKFPFNAFTRWLLDPFMRTRVVNHALHRSGLASRGIIQDLGIPYDTSEEFISYITKELDFWPLWLCPVKSPHAVGRKSFSMGVNALGHQDVMLDIGVWGIGPDDHMKFIKINRDIERKVNDLGGLKCLYAHAYYTEEEFWNIYDEKGYGELRRKYHAESLPSVYDKVKVDLKGVLENEKQGWVESRPALMTQIAWAVKGRVWGVYGVLSALKGMILGGDFVLKK
jgi:hypothetical protein